jgi:hypothetical protein
MSKGYFSFGLVAATVVAAINIISGAATVDVVDMDFPVF